MEKLNKIIAKSIKLQNQAVLIEWYNTKEEQHIPDDLLEIEMPSSIDDILSLEDPNTKTKIISIIK